MNVYFHASTSFSSVVPSNVIVPTCVAPFINLIVTDFVVDPGVHTFTTGISVNSLFVTVYPSTTELYPANVSSVIVYEINFPFASYLSNPVNVYFHGVSSDPFNVIIPTSVVPFINLIVTDFVLDPGVHTFTTGISVNSSFKNIYFPVASTVFVVLYPAKATSSTVYTIGVPVESYLSKFLNVYVHPTVSSNVIVAFGFSASPFAIKINVTAVDALPVPHSFSTGISTASGVLLIRIV